MTLLGIVLTAFAHLDQVPGVGEGGWPIEAVPDGLPHEGSWCHVVPTDAAMDVKEQLLPILRMTHYRSTSEAL